MMIKCSECGHAVSDKAGMCPGCGCPVLAQKAQADVTTELTSKRYKGYYLLFVGLFVFGLLGAGCCGKGPGGVICAMAFIAGFVGYICTRVLVWWHHA